MTNNELFYKLIELIRSGEIVLYIPTQRIALSLEDMDNVDGVKIIEEIIKILNVWCVLYKSSRLLEKEIKRRYTGKWKNI